MPKDKGFPFAYSIRCTRCQGLGHVTKTQWLRGGIHGPYVHDNPATCQVVLQYQQWERGRKLAEAESTPIYDQLREEYDRNAIQ